MYTAEGCITAVQQIRSFILLSETFTSLALITIAVSVSGDRPYIVAQFQTLADSYVPSPHGHLRELEESYTCSPGGSRGTVSEESAKNLPFPAKHCYVTIALALNNNIHRHARLQIEECMSQKGDVCLESPFTSLPSS